MLVVDFTAYAEPELRVKCAQNYSGNQDQS